MNYRKYLLFFFAVLLLGIISYAIDIGETSDCPDGYGIMTWNNKWWCANFKDVITWNNVTVINNISYYNESIINTTILYVNGTRITSSGSSGVTYYYVNKTELKQGTTTTLYLNPLNYYDNVIYNITEASGANSIDFRINFTGVTTFTGFKLREHYLGSASHEILFSLYNFDNSQWEQYYSIVGQGSFNWINIEVDDVADHISGGKVMMRINHTQTGISSHKLYIDQAVLYFSPFSVSSSTNLQGYAKYLYDTNYFLGNGSFRTSGNVSGKSIIASLNVTSPRILTNNISFKIGKLYISDATDPTMRLDQKNNVNFTKNITVGNRILTENMTVYGEGQKNDTAPLTVWNKAKKNNKYFL